MTAASATSSTSSEFAPAPAAGDQTAPSRLPDELDLEGPAQLCQALRSQDFLTFLGSEPLRFNQLAHVPCAGSIPLGPADPERVREAFGRFLQVHEKRDFKGTLAHVASAVSLVAREHPFHPVAEYLEKLVWDRKPRLARVAAEVLDVDADSAGAASQLIRKWCISAVAAAFRPGTTVEGVLVLVGSGRLSSDVFFRMLIPAGLYLDLPARSGGRRRLQLRRAWVYAFSDLARRTQGVSSESLASLLDDLADEVEGPFAVPGERAPRSTVFAATAEDLPVVRSAGLAHRLWGVPVGMNLDADKLVSWRDQLWAEAVSEFRSGASWLLTPAEDERRSRLTLTLQAPDPWDEHVFAFMQSHERPRIEEVLDGVFLAVHGFDHGHARWDMNDQRRAGAILHSMGYQRRRISSGGERHVYWVRSKPGPVEHDGGKGGKGGSDEKRQEL
jgi:putative DNA primase/helicase